MSHRIPTGYRDTGKNVAFADEVRRHAVPVWWDKERLTGMASRLLRRGGQRSGRVVVATPLPRPCSRSGAANVTHVRAFVRFCYDFIVGDDWRLAAVAVLALCVTALAAQGSIPAWPLAPILVSAALAVSVAREPRR
jgi:hypothetical protein